MKFTNEPRVMSATSSPAVSPLAPETVPQLPAIAGVTLGAVAAGIRYRGRHDLMAAVLDEGTTIAGVLDRKSVV